MSETKEVYKMMIPESIHNLLIRKGFEKLAVDGYSTDFLEVNFLDENNVIYCHIYNIEITRELIARFPVFGDMQKVIVVLNYLLS